MTKIYNSANGIITPEEFASNNIKYGLSLGRRQPMHIVHLDCILEIVKAGLHPVIIMGSTNLVSSSLYNPLKNPLTLEQQVKQIKIAMSQAEVTNFTLISLPDTGETLSWSENIQKQLIVNNINPREAVFHYRKKVDDVTNNKEKILPLSQYDSIIMQRGISIWQSANSNSYFDKVNATEFRNLDIESEAFTKRKKDLVCADFIIEEVMKARERNYRISKDVPLTMVDLSFDRFVREKGLVIDNYSISSMENLLNILRMDKT